MNDCCFDCPRSVRHRGRDEGLGAYGVHVLIGDDEAQHRWRSDDRENIYSVSKGVCALAIGMAVAESVLTLDSTVPELLPEMELGPGVSAVTVEHLLTMTSGIDFAWFGDQPVPGPDLAQEMLHRPTRGPGSVFQYSDASTYVAMRLLGAVVGDVRNWLLPRLFEPLGIGNPQWHRCRSAGSLAAVGSNFGPKSWPESGVCCGTGVGGAPSNWSMRPGSTGCTQSWVETGAKVRSRVTALPCGKARASAGGSTGRYGQYVIVDEARHAVVTLLLTRSPATTGSLNWPMTRSRSRR